MRVILAVGNSGQAAKQSPLSYGYALSFVHIGSHATRSCLRAYAVHGPEHRQCRLRLGCREGLDEGVALTRDPLFLVEIGLFGGQR